MSAFLKRNLKMFFRDKSAVFFSVMAVFIIIGLYAIILNDVWLPSNMKNLKNVDFLMNTWLVSGLLTVISVTTTMGAFGILIEDKIKKIDKDFHSSPKKKSTLIKGYLGSAFLIGIIMSLVTFLLSEIYIVLNNGEWIKLLAALKVLLIIILSVMTNTSIMCFIISFFKSQNAFGTAASIIGTLIGFLTGVYLPIGNLPDSIQFVVKIFPVSHAAVLFRQVLMQQSIQTSFSGVDPAALAGFKEYMGITYSFNGHIISPLICVAVLIVTSIIFYILSVLNFSRHRK